MSRIGNRVIIIPEGVTVETNDNIVKVSGPKGSMEMTVKSPITIEVNGNEITLKKNAETKEVNMLHGTMNSNLNNIIKGCKEGFKKELEIIGVGYKFAVQGTIELTLKYGQNKERVITGLKRISKPGLRVYAKAGEVPKVLNGLGIAVISTSHGVMTDKEARKENLGGEVLCYIW